MDTDYNKSIFSDSLNIVLDIAIGELYNSFHYLILRKHLPAFRASKHPEIHFQIRGWHLPREKNS